MEAALALAAVRAVQVPLSLLTALHLTGSLWPRKVTVKNHTCFDYIVVGAGTAGSIIANRLTEDNKTTVLLIEAGGDPPIEALFPLLFVLQPESKTDWDYYSTYDNYAATSQNNFTKQTSGKMLGGSSSLNHFIYVRGPPYDYNLWAALLDDPTWKYSNVLNYFKKSDNLVDEPIKNSPYAEFHGTDGPIQVRRELYEEANNYLTSFGEGGNNIIFDVNGIDTLGYVQALLTLSPEGVRQSTALKYLSPIKDKTNLFVLRNTLVTKILFDDNRRAFGVMALRDDKIYTFRASKEVILCAGVFNSPQVLMLSGIGPRESLESLNIDVIADLPVGDNYQDQVSVSIVHRMEKSLSLPPPLVPTKLPFPLTTGLISLLPGQPYADYQTFSLVLAHDSQLIILTCAVVFGYRPEICDKFNLKATGHTSLYTVLALLRPKSRGTVRLRSTNPKDYPLITTGFFKDEEDLTTMVKAVKDFIRVNNSTYFTEVGANIIDPELPECKDNMYGSDEYWRCYILHTAISPYHSTSTCAMGQVIDSKFRVKTVSNLRVVDASSILQLPSGNPHAVVLMMAEKASDDIKNESKEKPTCKELERNDCMNSDD